MARTWGLFSTTSAHCWGQGKELFFQGKGVSSAGHLRRETATIVYQRGTFYVELFGFFYPLSLVLLSYFNP